MPHLFLIQAHKDPLQVSRLVRILRQGYPDAVVVISQDARAPALPDALFGDDPSVHVVQGQGGRGDFAILDGYLRALRWVHKQNIEYDWVTNLSGQDYPVSSLAAFDRELFATKADGFLHHFDVLRASPAEMAPMLWPPNYGYNHYYFQYSKLKDELGGWERAALALPRLAAERSNSRYRINTAYGLLLGRRAKQTPFGRNFRCYGGSYWHTIRRRCVTYLLEFCESRPDVVRYFRSVLIPDESFTQTVLVNAPGFNFVNDNRRYYDMRASRHGHPKILNESDETEFLGKTYVFARKFAWQSDTTLFDRLDRHALA
jgi:hypothetical protein